MIAIITLAGAEWLGSTLYHILTLVPMKCFDMGETTSLWQGRIVNSKEQASWQAVVPLLKNSGGWKDASNQHDEGNSNDKAVARTVRLITACGKAA